MRKILEKIKNRCYSIGKMFWQDAKYFSIKLAFIRLLGSLCQLLRLKNISLLFQNKKNKFVISYLLMKYSYVFKTGDCKQDNEKKQHINDAPIWVCWLGGLEQAPELVKRCISSINENADGHPVHLITFSNIVEYIEIPDFIYEKLKQGKIGMAHFSDIVRVFLLEKYGGLWLDATIYCSRNIPDDYFHYDIFSCKSNIATPGCVSDNRWTTFCLGGQKNEQFFSILKEFFTEYWKKEECAIDYLFFDDAIEIARMNNNNIKNKLDNIPINNEDRDKLISFFADSWEEKKNIIFDLINGNTVLYKLGYREEYYLQKKNKEGFDTVCLAFLNEKF